jgi:hypothetical protein
MLRIFPCFPDRVYRRDKAVCCLQWCAGMCNGGSHPNVADAHKDDWICTLALASHDVLCLGTHLGRLQRVLLPAPGSPCSLGSGQQEERWQQLWQSPRGQPLSCLAVRACIPLHRLLSSVRAVQLTSKPPTQLAVRNRMKCCR